MPEQQEEKNRAIIESLRESFTVIAQRLTPEVEPAVIYSPREPSDESE